MPKPVLINLVKSNIPLVEVYIGLKKGCNLNEIIRQLNLLADDLEASPNIYNKMNGDNNLSIDATPEALLRIFGWKINRVRARAWNHLTRQHESEYLNFYCWEESNRPTIFPVYLEENMTAIEIIQPGASDHGTPYP